VSVHLFPSAKIKKRNNNARGKKRKAMFDLLSKRTSPWALGSAISIAKAKARKIK
jgi:hypothetical protein